MEGLYMRHYVSKRYIDGKVRCVIVDKDGNITNKKPVKNDLKDLEDEPYKVKKYTSEELLSYLRRFENKYGRPPTRIDFNIDQEYPSCQAYKNRFGSWSNALKLAGMNMDIRVKHGILKTEIEKGRSAEIKVLNHFKLYPVDLAGENCISPCDGICPNGKTYDVKSSKLHESLYYRFFIRNKYKEEIELFYLLGFNEDFSKLNCAWRIPGEIIEKTYFIVGLSGGYEFNIKNMKEYDITDKFRESIPNNGFNKD